MTDLNTLLAGEDGRRESVNVKFFRGSRDLISAEEFKRQLKSALMQRKMRTASVDKVAPKSAHPVIDVSEFVKTL